jgi:hypothetical protein
MMICLKHGKNASEQVSKQTKKREEKKEQQQQQKHTSKSVKDTFFSLILYGLFCRFSCHTQRFVTQTVLRR